MENIFYYEKTEKTYALAIRNSFSIFSLKFKQPMSYPTHFYLEQLPLLLRLLFSYRIARDGLLLCFLTVLLFT